MRLLLPTALILTPLCLLSTPTGRTSTAGDEDQTGTPAYCVWYCGTGVNGSNDGFVVTGLPFVGGTFSARVTAAGPNTGALLAAYSTPWSSFMTGWGELLVNIAEPGGELLGLPSAVGNPAFFNIPVPNNPALVGFRFYVQAAGFGGGILLHCAWECMIT